MLAHGADARTFFWLEQICWTQHQKKTSMMKPSDGSKSVKGQSCH